MCAGTRTLAALALLAAPAQAQTACADLNSDSLVDVSDLLLLLAAFGANGDGDVDGDGATDVTDLLQLLSGFGTSCSAGGALDPAPVWFDGSSPAWGGTTWYTRSPPRAQSPGTSL